MLDANEAVRRLRDPELMKLVFLVAVGWWLLTTGGPADPAPSAGLYRSLSEAARRLLVLVGYALFFGGGTALAFKVVHDATALARS